MTNELTNIDKAKQSIIKNEKAFKAVLPSNFNVQKFIATFCLEVQKNEKLALCDNLIEVGRDVANFGLVIGGLANQAHIIPYYNYKTKKYSAQLIIGYRGYIAKLEEAGYFIECELVTNEEIEGDRYEEIRGSNPQIIHRPIRKGVRKRENIASAYCIATSSTGAQIISSLSKEDIEEMAKTSQWTEREDGKKTREIALSNIWLNKDRETDYGQMCLKTVIRNLAKKINLKIVNEMSAYEGKRDEEIMKDVTPKSKTASAHQPPKAIEQSFIQQSEPVQTDLEDAVRNHEGQNQSEMFEVNND